MNFGQAVVLKLFKRDIFNESLDAYFGFGLGGCKEGSQINHIYIRVCRNVLHMTPTGARKKDKVLQGFTVFGMISCIQYTPTNLQFHDTLNWPVCNSESPTAALSLAYQDPRERYQEHIRKAAEFFPTQLFHHRTWWRSRTPTSLSRATGPQPRCTVHATMEAVRSTIFENINLLQSIKEIYHNFMDDGNL